MEQIRKLREARGWTQEQLSHEAGVSQAMISAAESGKRVPRLRWLAKIAKALGVREADLITKEEAYKVEPLELLDLLADNLDRHLKPSSDAKTAKMMILLLRSELEKITEEHSEE